MAKRVQFDHLVPVGVGRTVRAEATLDRIEGRRLTFTVSVSDPDGLIGAGKVARVVVDRAASSPAPGEPPCALRAPHPAPAGPPAAPAGLGGRW